jgi:hypothetical protein
MAIRGEAGRPGRLIDEIGGEARCEYFKVPTALNLFSIPTNDCDSGIR